MKHSIVITEASSGFAALTALALAQAGHTVCDPALRPFRSQGQPEIVNDMAYRIRAEMLYGVQSAATRSAISQGRG